MNIMKTVQNFVWKVKDMTTILKIQTFKKRKKNRKLFL